MTPTRRFLRTLLQALVAFLVALPLALAKVPIPAKYTGSVALVLGIAAGLVVVISALQNVVEAKAGVALFHRSPPAVEAPAPAPLTPPVPPNPENPGAPRRGPP